MRARACCCWPASTRALPGIISSAARARASTKENPSARCFFSDSLKASGSSSIISMILSVRQSGFSAPKDRCVTARAAARMSTAPFANTPALCAEKRTGSSSTRSAPQASAAFARVHLSASAGSPRWTKAEDSTATAACAPQSSRALRMWSRWPLWNGLYSATIPTTGYSIKFSPSFPFIRITQRRYDNLREAIQF